MSELIHGTAVSIDRHGVLFTGPSSAGKSDLALRLISSGARLIADDIVILSDFTLTAPDRLRGQIEVRGVGIVPTSFEPDPCPLALHVSLVPRSAVPRLPDPHACTYGVPCIALHAFDASTPLKVRLALDAALRGSDDQAARIMAHT